MTTPRAMGRVTLILLAAALLLGASSVTGKPITDVHIIEGKWRGQISFTGRVITLRPDFGGWDVQVRPLK
jgi:hypothetical protein